MEIWIVLGIVVVAVLGFLFARSITKKSNEKLDEEEKHEEEEKKKHGKEKDK